MRAARFRLKAVRWLLLVALFVRIGMFVKLSPHRIILQVVRSQN